MVTTEEKAKILKLLKAGDDVTIIQHGLSASLWTQICRAMPIGSNQEIIGKKISDTKDGMIVSYGGIVEMVIPYYNLTHQSIEVLNKLNPSFIDPIPSHGMEIDRIADLKLMVSAFGIPHAMVGIYDA